MKFYGSPNMLVRVVRPKRGMPKTFRFNKVGEYETDNTFLIIRLKKKFAYNEENINSYKNMTYKELQESAKERGIRWVGVKKLDLIARLEVE